MTEPSTLRVLLTQIQDTHFAIGLDEVARIAPFKPDHYTRLLRLPSDTTPLKTPHAPPRKLAMLTHTTHPTALVLGLEVNVQTISAHQCAVLPAWLLPYFPAGLHPACLTTSPLTWFVNTQALLTAYSRTTPC